MFINEPIIGKYVILKSATVDDADFTLQLRQNPNLTKFLPKLNISISEQRKWLNSQKNREGDYFFVVYNNVGERIGVLGLYDINDNSGETGRLAIIGNPLESLEAQYLSFVFAFDVLELSSTKCFIYEENSKAIRLSEFFGTTFSSLSEDEKGNKGYHGLLSRENFKKCEKSVKRVLHIE